MPGPEEFRWDIRAAKRFGLMQGLLVLLSLFGLYRTFQPYAG